MQLTFGFSLTPSLGVLVDAEDIETFSSPNGFSLGLWGQYDFAKFGETTTYALGGFNFIDFSNDAEDGVVNRSELQYGLGVGAALPLANNIGAFTNLRYTLVDGMQNETSYDGTSTGLEIGIEISF